MAKSRDGSFLDHRYINFFAGDRTSESVLQMHPSIFVQCSPFINRRIHLWKMFEAQGEKALVTPRID